MKWMLEKYNEIHFIQWEIQEKKSKEAFSGIYGNDNLKVSYFLLWTKKCVLPQKTHKEYWLFLGIPYLSSTDSLFLVWHSNDSQHKVNQIERSKKYHKNKKQHVPRTTCSYDLKGVKNSFKEKSNFEEKKYISPYLSAFVFICIFCKKFFQNKTTKFII